MRRRIDINDDDGITLAEVLVTALLTVIVMGAVATLMISLLSTPKTVTSRVTAATSAQLAAKSIYTGIRNSSDFRLTTPAGDDQLLVARTAQSGSEIVWVCSAWYYSATDDSIVYLQSPTIIPALPTSSELGTWTLLGNGISPTSGTGIFTATGGKVTVSFRGAVSDSSNPQIITTSVFSRAGSTGSPECY